MKISIIIPVYFNEDNLHPLYENLKKEFISKIDYEYEIIMINDGSEDGSYRVMKEIANNDANIKIISLSRNFGSHAAILCGLNYCTGDCAVIKAADLQEPTSMILEMINSWRQGNNVVLAVRTGRDEAKNQTFFANTYYRIVKKFALKNMPEQGFDVYLLDRKVINVLTSLDEKNSALTGQILWSGFKTGIVPYHRLAREIGNSRWTLKKKVRLVMDTMFSFSVMPITIVLSVGALSVIGALIWTIVEIVMKLCGKINVQGWTMLFIIQLLSFGIIMMTLGIIGEYLWRTFDSSRNRPTYIVEDSNIGEELSSKKEQ